MMITLKKYVLRSAKITLDGVATGLLQFEVRCQSVVVIKHLFQKILTMRMRVQSGMMLMLLENARALVSFMVGGIAQKAG